VGECLYSAEESEKEEGIETGTKIIFPMVVYIL